MMYSLTLENTGTERVTAKSSLVRWHDFKTHRSGKVELLIFTMSAHIRISFDAFPAHSNLKGPEIHRRTRLIILLRLKRRERDSLLMSLDLCWEREDQLESRGSMEM